MTNARRRMLALTLAFAFFVWIPGQPAQARGNDFAAVVRLVETHYRARRRRMPFFANTLMRGAARFAGVRGFRLAVFENQDFSARAGDNEFMERVRAALREEWQPIVRVSSRDGERTLIYARESGERLRLLIVNIEPREATIAQLEVAPQMIARWLNGSDRTGRALLSQAANPTP